MFIAVEGIDCSGKGTICPLIANKLNARLYKTPPEHMRAEQELINKTASNQEHYEYFIKVVQEASIEIQKLLEHGRRVVVDRWWMTTVVYHRAMGIPATLDDLTGIIHPDYTIYLTVNPEDQKIRMGSRGMSAGDIRMDGRQDLIRQYYQEVIKDQKNVITINTSDYKPEEVVTQAFVKMLLVI